MLDFRSLSKETKAKIIKRYRDNNRPIPEAIKIQLEEDAESGKTSFSKESIKKISQYYHDQNKPIPELFEEILNEEPQKKKKRIIF